MPRVVHVISGIDPQNGGPTVALLGMARAQRAVGIDASVVSTWRYETGLENAAVFEQAGVPIRMVGPARGKLSWHPGLGKILREAFAPADVVHVHAVWEQAQHVACRVASALGKPIVFTPHGMLSEWNMAQGGLAKRAFLALRVRRNLNSAARLHFTTRAEADSTAKLGLTSKPLIETLGLDLGEFAALPSPGFLRARWPAIGDRKVVLFLGRIDYKKGLDLLVPAFARCRAAADAVLVLAGPDNDGYGATVSAIAAKEGIADRVIFTGMLHGADRIAALVDADLFAMTSYIENFGVSVIEALAAGKPLLLTRGVQAAEFLSDTEVVTVSPPEVGAITAAMEGWLADPARRARAAAEGPRLARERFDNLAVARRWLVHYTNVAAEAAR